MSARRIVPAVAAAFAALALGGPASAANECQGIRDCISVPGPWVFVPARGEVTYLLDCPRRRGIVAGLDALATSRAIRVWFDAQMGSPVGPGRSTTRYAFFRAVSADGRPGFVRPYIGCVPTGGGRQTTAVPAGQPLTPAATTVRLRPGTVRRTTIGCVSGQRLVDGWHAIAFRTPREPDPALAAAIRVERTVRGKQIAVSIVTSEALPAGAKAEVQLGVRCAAP